MKYSKAFILLMAVVMAACVSGCGNGSSSDKKASESSTTQSSTASTVESSKDSSEESSEESKTESSEESKAQSSAESEEESSEDESSVPVILESNTEETSVIEFEAEASKPYDTLEEYLDSDAAKEAAQKLQDSDEEDILTTDLFVEDDTKLVFERKLIKEFNPDLYEEFVENITESVESQEEVFTSLVDELESCINKKNLTVVIRYKNYEGEVLYEKEFDNDKYADELSALAESMDNSSDEDTDEENTDEEDDTSDDEEVYEE